MFGLWAAGGGGLGHSGWPSVAFGWGSRGRRTAGGGGLAARFWLAAQLDGDLDDLSDLLVNQLHDTYMDEAITAQPISRRYLAAHPRDWGARKGETCPICLDDFHRAQRTMRLDCKHVFHEACIVRWFDEQNTCPTCRCAFAPMTDKERQELEREEREEAFAQAQLDAAAAGAAACPGDPFALLAATEQSFKRAVAVAQDELPASDPLRVSTADPVLGQILAQLDALQERNEVERRSRLTNLRRHAERGARGRERASSQSTSMRQRRGSRGVAPRPRLESFHSAGGRIGGLSDVNRSPYYGSRAFPRSSQSRHRSQSENGRANTMFPSLHGEDSESVESHGSDSFDRSDGGFDDFMFDHDWTSEELRSFFDENDIDHSHCEDLGDLLDLAEALLEPVIE